MNQQWFSGHTLPTTSARRQSRALNTRIFHLVCFKRKNEEIAPLTLFSGPHSVILNSFEPHPRVTSPPKHFKPKMPGCF